MSLLAFPMEEEREVELELSTPQGERAVQEQGARIFFRMSLHKKAAAVPQPFVLKVHDALESCLPRRNDAYLRVDPTWSDLRAGVRFMTCSH